MSPGARPVGEVFAWNGTTVAVEYADRFAFVRPNGETVEIRREEFPLLPEAIIAKWMYRPVGPFWSSEPAVIARELREGLRAPG